MRVVLLRALLLGVFAASLWPAAAAAQPSSTLAGVVTAADGARLPGVTLRVINTDSGAAVQVVSSEAGLFRIGSLPPGPYALEADFPGFQPRRVGGILLSDGNSPSIVVRLEIASLQETVRVVGTAPHDSIAAFEMRESHARDVGEAMSALPGIASVRKGAIAADVVVRGLQGKDVTVLIDGQRVDGACPGHMDPPAFHVDFAEVTRVELSRGPFDVKNQGALAGVVNVVTERPQRGWHGSANANVASASTLASSASASLGGARWALLGGASARRADVYRDGRGVPITDGAGYRAEAIESEPAYDVWTAWGRIAAVPRPGTTVQVSYTRQSAGTILYPYLQMDAGFDNADRAGARIETTTLPGGWDALAAHVYYTHVDHWMTDEFRASGAGKAREYSMGTRAKSTIGGARAEIQRPHLSLGFETSRRRWNTSTMMAMRNYVPQSAMPDVVIDVWGGFASYSAAPGRHWRLDAGARLDRAEAAPDAALANTALYLAYHNTTALKAEDLLPAAFARASWRGESGLSVIAGAGHSTRLPDQQERFYAVQRMGTDWVGNPGLTPSHNTGLEGEVRYARRGIEGAISAFVYRLDDHIRVVNQPRVVMVPGVMNVMARSYSNLDALMRGFEVSATVPLGPALFLSGDASLVRGTMREGSGNLPEIPPARARVRLRYDRARWNASAEIVGAARQTKIAADLREMPTAGFAIANLRMGVRARSLTLSAAIDNVFDTTYTEHLSYQRDPFRNGLRVNEPGRTVSVNIGARF